jgi:hypothetical protein
MMGRCCLRVDGWCGLGMGQGIQGVIHPQKMEIRPPW